MKNITSILYLFLFTALAGLAQTDGVPALTTDRPTQSTGPYFVPKGALQLETGMMFTNRTDHIDERKMMSIANSNLRYGIYDHFEVNVMGSFEQMSIHTIADDSDTTISGFGGVSAGFKTFVCEEKGIRPQIAIIGIIHFRHIGNQTFAPMFSYPLGKLVAMHNLSKRMQLGYNIGFSYDGLDADGFFVYSGYLGYYLSAKLWAFAEAYGKFDNGNFPKHRADAGLTYLINPTFQLDLSAGTGISKLVSRKFISAGLSWRINK